MRCINRFIAVTLVSGAVLAGCGGSSSISETTSEFPKCDTPAGKVTVDTLVCNRGPCREREKVLRTYQHKYGADSIFGRMAQAKGYEGNTIYGLYDANDKITHMLINALQETGCFTEVKLYSRDKDHDTDFRISGALNEVYATTSGSKNEPLNRLTNTNAQTQKARLKMTLEVNKGEALGALHQKKFEVSAKRVGERKSDYSGFDWMRKGDDEGFGDTAMQDVANEIVLEAASFVTEKTAGLRITHRVAPPTRTPEGTTGKKSSTAGQTEKLESN